METPILHYCVSWPIQATKDAENQGSKDLGDETTHPPEHPRWTYHPNFMRLKMRKEKKQLWNNYETTIV
jgi:hypothetical protein